MSGNHILLIDDDLPFLGLMQDILEMKGYIFTGLTQTDDIVQLAREVHPDLILLDYQLTLTGINGGDLCRILRNCPETKKIPVVLLSACSREEIPLERIDCSVFVPKPFDLWEFLACLEELLRFKGIEHAA